MEAVIFDLDNTLINRKSAFKIFTERFIDKFIATTGPQHTSDIIEYIEKADQNGYRKKPELFRELLENLEMKHPETTVDQLLEFWFAELYICTVLMDGAIEVLEYLKSKGTKLGLITNGSIHSQNMKIDEVKIRDYFDTIVISDEVGVKKPDKRIFEIALKRLDVYPQFTCYIGDHPINDVKGARDAGIYPIWIKGFMEWDASIEKPDMIISKLSELAKLMNDF